MSITSGFFNSKSGDRKYNTEQISSMFDGVIGDGVFATIGTSFVAKPGSGMNVNIGIGKAWYNHSWLLNDAVYPVTIQTADPLFDRYDAVIMEFNNSEDVRANTIKYIKGSPASSPKKPALTNTTQVIQKPICYVLCRKGATSIGLSDIENCIGTSQNPFVTGLLKVIELDELLGQWQGELDDFVAEQTGEFQTWFDSIKGKLSGDIAGSLQLQINDLSSSLDQKVSNLQSQINSITPEKIGAEPKFTKKSAFNKDFGESWGTVCQGNDWRLSNARRASNISMSYDGSLRITYS